MAQLRFFFFLVDLLAAKISVIFRLKQLSSQDIILSLFLLRSFSLHCPFFSQVLAAHSTHGLHLYSTCCPVVIADRDHTMGSKTDISGLMVRQAKESGFTLSLLQKDQVFFEGFKKIGLSQCFLNFYFLCLNVWNFFLAWCFPFLLYYFTKWGRNSNWKHDGFAYFLRLCFQTQIKLLAMHLFFSSIVYSILHQDNHFNFQQAPFRLNADD